METGVKAVPLENRILEPYSLSQVGEADSFAPTYNRLSVEADGHDDGGDLNSLTFSPTNGPRRNSKGQKDKKVKNERLENTTVVVGTIETIEAFTEFTELVTKTCGLVRSTYYRAYQFCGFIYFHDEETATKAKTTHNGYDFRGQILKVCPPLSYFDNELDARPIPPESARRASKDIAPSSPVPNEEQHRRSSDVAIANAGTPACTLVLKNLHFNLKQEKLIEMLSQMGITPQSVNYHYDQNGNFCGIAFAKYKRVEEATKALEMLAGLDIGKRKLRVEYKRRKSIQTTPSSSPLVRGSVAGQEMLDSNHMDPEQNQILNDLMKFLENSSVSEMSFPSSMSITQRSQVHIIAEHLGLCHMTDEVNDMRYVVVSKSPMKEEPTRRSRHMSCDSNNTSMASPLMLPRPAPQLPRVGVIRNTWPKEHLVQPKGPDGSKGFAFGRGRRVSTPLEVPTFNQGLISSQIATVSSVLGCGIAQPPPRSSVRSASVPVVVMHQGTEFAS